MAEIKSMSLEQARAYRDTLKKQGKSESTSKEYAKVADYIKVLKSQAGQGGYGQKELAAAYTNLSRGVTKAGGWTEQNAENIYKYTGERPTFTQDKNGNPLGGGDLSSGLEKYQQSVYGASSNPEVRDSIINQIEPEGGMPDTVDWSDMYDEWRDDLGVSGLEDNLNTLNDQLQMEMDITEERTLDAEGKPVAMGVISGRVTEIERQQNTRIRGITRQIDSISNQLNTAYNVIQTYMQFERMEYQDAMDRYNTEFSNNLKMYELTMAEMDRNTQMARANLTLFTNAITEGNMDYNSLSPDQKAFISKLEVQSGLPIGFIGSLHMKGGKLVGTNSSGSQAVIVDGNGNYVIEEMPLYTPAPSSGSSIGTVSEGGGWTYTGVTDSNKLGWTQNATSQSNIELSNSQIISAKKKVISLGGTQADLVKVASDPNFALWVLAQ